MDILAVVYGYTPILVLLLIVLDLLVRRGSRQLALCLFAVLSPAINEVLLKPWLAEPRPGSSGLLRNDVGIYVGSCTPSCGMPSSHATISIGLWLLTFLEAAVRVVPSSDRLRGATTVVAESAPGFGTGHGCMCSAAKSVLPQDLMTARQFTASMAVWSLLLLPVPMMRVRSYDHSVEQVVVGSIAGAFYAVVWHSSMVALSSRYIGSLGDTFLKVLRHNYLPAQFSVKVFDQMGVQGVKIEVVSFQEWREKWGLKSPTTEAGHHSAAP